MNQLFTWFPYSIVATLLFGGMICLYKYPSVKGYSKFAVMFWSLAASLVLSVVFSIRHLKTVSITVILLAIAWGISFTVLTLLQMHALKHVDTNVLFPITTTVSLALTIGTGITFFNDRLSLLQIAGIIIVIATAYLFLYKGGKLQYSKYLVYLGLSIIVLSALNKIIQKLAIVAADVRTYQTYQYIAALVFSFIIFYAMHRNDLKQQIYSGAHKIGLLIGSMSFFGGYAYLIALQKGPLSLVNAVHSLYIIVAAILAYFMFKEKLTTRKIILIILGIIAIILIRIG